MTFKLGTRSRASLAMTHPRLVLVIEGALAVSAVDFGVPDHATRTLAEQKLLVAQGRSQTLKSKHLVHPEGYRGDGITGKGWAADLVPFVDGGFVWDDPKNKGRPHPAFYDIALGMQVSARRLNEDVTWGAVWDRIITDLESNLLGLRKAVTDYDARHPGRDFNDYPHFQLGRN